MPETGRDRLVAALGRPELFRTWLAGKSEDVAGWPMRPDVNPLSLWLREAGGVDDVIIGGSSAFCGPWTIDLPDWAVEFHARTRAGHDPGFAISGTEALQMLDGILGSA